ncbi:hypothetical protein CR513_42865, partial [Mucuna pruriens]
MPTNEVRIVGQVLNTFIEFDGSKKKLEPKRLQVKVDPVQPLWKVASKIDKKSTLKFSDISSQYLMIVQHHSLMKKLMTLGNIGQSSSYTLFVEYNFEFSEH